MEGPSQAKIECDDKGDGSCDVRYWPTEAGEYAVHVLCNNEDIQHSPFMAEIVNPPAKDFYPDKVPAHPGFIYLGVQSLAFFICIIWIVVVESSPSWLSG